VSLTIPLSGRIGMPMSYLGLCFPGSVMFFAMSAGAVHHAMHHAATAHCQK